MNRALLLWLVASCTAPSASQCDDGQFCPAHTTCSGAGVCLADQGRCAGFPDRTPCLPENRTRRGYCSDGTCVQGVTVTGGAIELPSEAHPHELVVRVRDHAEIREVGTNANGFFEVLDAPRDSELVLELSFDGAVSVVTRPIVVGNEDVDAYAIYRAIPIILESFLTVTLSVVGIELEPTAGIVVGFAHDLAGMSLGEAVPHIANPGCEGPYYFNDDGSPVAGGSGTVSDNGIFAFANCPPGPTELEVMSGTALCGVLDRPVAAPIPIDVTAGRMLFIGVARCP